VRTATFSARRHASRMKAPAQGRTPCRRNVRRRERYRMRSIIALPKPEQDSCVAPSIRRAKS
jgi:hypothetical protein